MSTSMPAPMMSRMPTSLKAPRMSSMGTPLNAPMSGPSPGLMIAPMPFPTPGSMMASRHAPTPGGMHTPMYAHLNSPMMVPTMASEMDSMARSQRHRTTSPVIDGDDSFDDAQHQHGVQCRLFVGNLPNNIPANELLQILHYLFDKFGICYIQIRENIKHDGTKMPAAFVQYKYVAHADDAIRTVNGKCEINRRVVRAERASGGNPAVAKKNTVCFPAPRNSPVQHGTPAPKTGMVYYVYENDQTHADRPSSPLSNTSVNDDQSHPCSIQRDEPTTEKSDSKEDDLEKNNLEKEDMVDDGSGQEDIRQDNADQAVSISDLIDNSTSIMRPLRSCTRTKSCPTYPDDD
ncbi:hypothetical protein BBP40_001035 [Aspergillus hancockii]|nr:hypothetical protein BBP40_001035 [Aspergillus hancockii]